MGTGPRARTRSVLHAATSRTPLLNAIHLACSRRSIAAASGSSMRGSSPHRHAFHTCHGHIFPDHVLEEEVGYRSWTFPIGCAGEACICTCIPCSQGSPQRENAG